MLIVLTGPPGAGKTSVGEEIAKRFPCSVFFSLDTIRHFVKSGYLDPWRDAAADQLQLSESIAAEMIRRYTETGYVVIVDGIFFDDQLQKLKREFDDVHGFVLLPSLETAIRRDRTRPAAHQEPERSHILHRDYSGATFSDFKVLDSTEQTLRETVDAVYREVAGELRNRRGR